MGNQLVEAAYGIESRLFSLIIALAKERSPTVPNIVALWDFTHPNENAYVN
jgi:hypothetical protein